MIKKEIKTQVLVYSFCTSACYGLEEYSSRNISSTSSASLRVFFFFEKRFNKVLRLRYYIARIFFSFFFRFFFSIFFFDFFLRQNF